MNRAPALALAICSVVSLVAFPSPGAEGALPSTLQPCQRQIAKSSGKFLRSYLKENQKCTRQNLSAPGACAAPDASRLTEVEGKLYSDIDKKCGSLSTSKITIMGFPGFCTDPDGSPFSLDNLKDCMKNIHTTQGDVALGLQLGGTVGPLNGSLLRCQLSIASGSVKFLLSLLKAVQKCRDGIDGNKLIWNPDECEQEPKTARRISKAAEKLAKVIGKKCTDADIAALDICSPPATTVGEAINCLSTSYDTVVTDLVRFEYADPPKCGDNFLNQPGVEECDGTDDSACPGACGPPDSLFPCLCTNIPRLKMFEFKESDLDTGWTGDAHDHGVVEGGGYFLDLSYCDNVTDFDCLTGPHCSVTEQVCQQDSDCPLGESCVKTVTATGPHCSDNIMQACDICQGGSRDGQLCGTPGCPGGTCLTCSPEATCVKQLHGPPLPLSGGGVPVCVVTTFTEDVRGTRNLATGASSGRIRQSSLTHTGITVSKPCPVCGGFCDTPARELCATDADCPSNTSCITSRVCSDGLNKNKACRVDPPFGGPTTFFGTTSVDCPPSPSQNISGGGLDIVWDPIGTGTTTISASLACTKFMVCSGNGEECSDNSQCPQGETCVAPAACLCPGQERPNSCQPACVGGAADGTPCSTGSDCDSGVCRPAECRPNPLDPNAPTEGACPGGPIKGTCSVESFRGCNSDADCQQPGCPTCAPGQSCVFANEQCFTDPLVRTGIASTGVSFDQSIFCIEATSSTSVNISAGLPGPGAVRSPVTFFLTGL